MYDWTEGINTPDRLLFYLNVTNQKTGNNRPLKISEVRDALANLKRDMNYIGPDRIVALGKTAAKALTLLGVDFYEMPHPSGRNRLLNDPNYVQEKVKGLVSYCQPALDTDSLKSD